MSDSTSDNYKNIYRFPSYFSSMYGEQEDFNDNPLLSEDLTLGEYTLCYRAKTDVINSIRSIGVFSNVILPNINKIDTEISEYTETIGDGTDTSLFSNLVNYLQSNADQYILEFGNATTISPTYAHSIKTAYLESPILKADPQLSNLLDIITPTDIYSKVDIPEKFINMLVTSMFSSVIEKLGKNFKGSEFCIAFNLAVMEFNMQQFQLIEKLTSIENLKTHLLEFCQHTQTEILEYCDNLDNILDANHILSDGKIDYNGWAYQGRNEEDIDRIETVRFIANLILGNSWNEILSTTKLRSIFLTNTTFPNTSEE